MSWPRTEPCRFSSKFSKLSTGSAQYVVEVIVVVVLILDGWLLSDSGEVSSALDPPRLLSGFGEICEGTRVKRSFSRWFESLFITLWRPVD